MAVAILDIDGTLVDTNYQHAIAWFRAFRRYEMTLPIWRIHRHIGMGGDQLVPALAGDDFESEHGDDVREEEKALYRELIGEVQPMQGARKLIEELKASGRTVLLASSAKQEEVEHYLDLLDARDLADGWTSAADVESTKPEPDLVHSALQKAGAQASEAVMVGDSPYDVEAAKRAGVPTVAVLTGGFSEAELRDAGARRVYESVAELRERLDWSAVDAGRDVVGR
ncbi:MAG TPA: HAD family hydrolase [Solirubrobacteraceae bacterium]|jgi:HAD superfamily hydrolase (TIGR01509 family)|nr:HAD family hydrolase [Solirubrobacteraceae bacterium]